MLPLHEFVQGLRFGEPCVFQNLVMVPVVAECIRPEPGYLLLREALGGKLTKVTELGGGVVPELVLENVADRPVLILGGEELVGAKQNRMVNLTILAAPKCRIVIPVSCVESGRWRMASREFASSDFMAFAAIRAFSSSQVTESMRLERRRRTDQAHVWSTISRRAAELDTNSGTDAMHAIFEQRLSDVAEFIRAMPCQEGQIGAAFLIDGKPAGIDVFDHPSTMEKMREKLVSAYALDALAEQRAGERRKPGERPAATAGQQEIPAAEIVREWLKTIEGGETLIAPGVGMGQDVRVQGKRFTVAALWSEDRYIHVSAFPRDGTEGFGRWFY